MAARILFSVIALAALSCDVGVRTRTPAYVEVSSPPVEIETAPTVIYGGHATYFYRDHWYYRDHGSWRYYRHEPGILIEHRSRWHSNERHERYNRR
jgi:hypothetical protein